MKKVEDLSDFSTVILKDWGQIHKLQKHGWIYRGHQCDEWPLQTTLERCCDRHALPVGKRAKVERELFREFRRAYHLHAQHIPNETAVAEWLALMQHFGAPTRLLDFTYSIYVATYFATERARGEAAVWAVRFDWAMEHTQHRLSSVVPEKDPSHIETLLTKFDENSDVIIEPLFMTEPFTKNVCPINGFRLNERL